MGADRVEWINDGAQEALNRLGRAMKRGTGCYLTREMVAALDLTFIGELCVSPDPRRNPEDKFELTSMDSLGNCVS